MVVLDETGDTYTEGNGNERPEEESYKDPGRVASPHRQNGEEGEDHPRNRRELQGGLA